MYANNKNSFCLEKVLSVKLHNFPECFLRVNLYRNVCELLRVLEGAKLFDEISKISPCTTKHDSPIVQKTCACKRIVIAFLITQMIIL